jgi:hypothetical protein
MRYLGHWYYLEGGWGWTVCLAVCLVNLLTTGKEAGALILPGV